MLSALYAIAVPSVRRVYHTKTVDVRIMKFSPYGSPMPCRRHTSGLRRSSTAATLFHRQIVCRSTHTHNTFRDRSFAIVGPRVWNSLPAHLHDEDIKKRVKAMGKPSQNYGVPPKYGAHNFTCSPT